MRHPLNFALLAALSACGQTISGTPATDSAVDASADASADGGCAVGSSNDPLVVATDRGLVRGAVEEGAAHWLGIPFAAPPVASLRWRPPAATACWTGERDATQWAPSCPQIPQTQGQPFDPAAPIEGQEDCLTLNVWRPASARPDAALPVMVFIHGGGNVVGSAGSTGSGGLRTFDSTRLAERGGVVVVTIQYRLGALGWLAHPSLEADGSNAALLDQLAALRWVQRNVRSFGGDPARVLVFGESAGAVNTCALVASPLSAGLFSRALIESGSCTATQPVDVARGQGARYVTSAGCAAAPDVARCLRELPLETLIRTLASPVNVSGLEGGSVRWGPTVGAMGLPERPYDAMVAGRHQRVPLVVGHNAEELGLTIPAVPTEAAYRATLVSLGGEAVADRVMAAYPVSRYGTPRAALVQALSDARFGCGARTAARAALAGNRTQPGANVYRYLYAHPLEAGSAMIRALGAWHGLELVYVFQNVARGALRPTANDLAVERTMLGYWTRFAATGDPNGGGAPVWPAYGAGEPLLRIAPMLTTENMWRGAECDGWDMLSGLQTPAP